MSILNPLFLWGLLALGVPIVLHLIQRQRYPERAFTTLRFFDKTIKHNVIQRRFVDRLLLLLRLALLALLALALARPFGLGVGEKRMSLAIVLDNSPSMGRSGTEGRTFFEEAKQAVMTALKELAPGDRAEVLFTSQAPPAFTRDRKHIEERLELRQGQPTGLLLETENGFAAAKVPLSRNPDEVKASLVDIPDGASLAIEGIGMTERAVLSDDHAALVRLVETASLSQQHGDVSTAAARARSLLERSKDGDRSIVIFTDMQKTDWARRPGIDLKGARLTVFGLAGEGRERGNLAIKDCIVPQREVRFGERATCTALIHNYGPEPSSPSTLLNVQTAGQKQPSQVNVPSIISGGTEAVPFTITAMSRGRTVFCTISLESSGDAFAYDDSRHFQIPVRPPMTVLCVNGFSGASLRERSGFFVANALSPRTATAKLFAEVNECSSDELGDKELFPYSVVILTSVEKLEGKARKRLRTFIEDGGGVLVFPGHAASSEEYNGWTFLPARVQEVREKEFAFVKTFVEEAAALHELEGNFSAMSGLSSNQWISMEPIEGAATLAYLSSGMPALVESSLGKGRVILAAASGHSSESDWPLRPAFVLLARSLVSHLADSNRQPAMALQRDVGHRMARTIPAEMAGGAQGAFRMSITKASLVHEPLPWLLAGRSLHLPATARTGHYLLSVQPTAAGAKLTRPGLGANIISASMNHHTSESDLTAASSDDLKSKFTNGEMNVASLKDGFHLADLRRGRDLWRLFALAALLMLFVESLVAWRVPSDAEQ